MTSTEISLVEVGGNSNQSTDVEREKLNVNSPRSGTKNTNLFAAPAHLITQVNQDDVERQKEMAKKMGGRKNEQEENKQNNVSSDDSPSASRSSTRGISGWLCCGSCKRNDQQFLVNPADDSSGRKDDSQNIAGSDDNNWAGETKIVDDVNVNNEDVKEENFAIEISETDETALLDPVDSADQGRKCLVLDLDETLVHSSFSPVECSFSIPIMLDGNKYKVFVLKRPFVDEFIEECAKYYELVVFTASLSEYANPVIDTLDKKGLIKHRLFRESCVFHQNQMYVKDLSRLGRNINDCIIIDNSPYSYLFDPTNAIGCTSWFGDQSDTELRDLLPVLKGPLLGVNDVRTMLDARGQTCEWLIKQYANTE